MKVWLVFSDDNGQSPWPVLFCGVFSTEAKALAYVERIAPKNPQLEYITQEDTVDDQESV